ncbi:MAG: type II toxin-antitoxin system RelE/ParE family toxin [Alphaproteobacteria bacterium]|nr:type II toxin-antitoxin system RelE/ParE family toxin [Alphaproteobacteria bacterium]
MARRRRRSITWSPEARTDLDEIWDYYFRVAGRQPADNAVRKITDACRFLEDHPFGGRSRDKVRTGLRSIVALRHVVFYRVSAEIPEIVRVLDGRRDLGEIFSDEAS